MSIQKLFNRQFCIFILGGVLSAIVDIGVMQLLFLLMQVNPFLAATAGFISGLIVNYLYHLTFTFKSQKSINTLIRFMVVVGVNYILTLMLIYVSFSILSVGVLLGKMLSLPLVAVNGYFLSKYWVFK